MNDAEYQNTNEKSIPLPALQTTVEARQAREKSLLLEQMKKTPIVQVACEKTGVSRASFYRWRKEDKEFAKASDEALAEGTGLMNDAAESQLLKAIRDENLSAIIFWLKHRHPAFTNRLEVTTNLNPVIDALTPEQEALVKRALRLSGLTQEGETHGTIEHQSNPLAS